MNVDSEDFEIYYIAEDTKEDYTRWQPKIYYLQVFCWAPSRPASGKLRKDNQIPGGRSY